jgi:hypothetical protein
MSYKFISGLVLVVAVVVGGYYAWQHNASHSGLAGLSADAKVTDDQVAQLVARISKFIVVPADEKPSVVVIKGVEQLAAQQAFYKGAKDGDVLVLYSSRAFIYVAAADKLIIVGPVVRIDAPPSYGQVASGSASATPTPSTTPSVTPKPITVDVRNGTSTAGLAGATASALKKNTLVTIGKVGDASGSYTATVVVDLSKDAGKSATVAQIAASLGVSVVTTLPKGETASTADALVIVGK